MISGLNSIRFRSKDDSQETLEKLSLGRSVVNAIKYGGNPKERREAINKIIQGTVMQTGQTQEEMSLLEAVRGLTGK